jgi:hypothetical protein
LSAASSALNLFAIGFERVTVGFPRACLSNSARVGEECAGGGGIANSGEAGGQVS